MPYYGDEGHLVGSRSRSRQSAYSVSSDEFEEVVSAGASPIPAARRPRSAAPVDSDNSGGDDYVQPSPAAPSAPPPTTSSSRRKQQRQQVISVDIPFGYYSVTKNADAARTTATAPEALPSSASRGYYPREVDVTAPPRSSHSRKQQQQQQPRQPSRNSSDADSSEEAEDEEDEPAGMFDVLATEHDDWLRRQQPQQPPQPQPQQSSSRGSARAQPDPVDEVPSQTALDPSSSAAVSAPVPATPQPVLYYTTPFMGLDFNYVHDAQPSDTDNGSRGGSHFPHQRPPLPASSWAVSGCGGAVPNQCFVCLLSSVFSCCALPCVIGKERQMLLFNDLEGRYVCCAGIMPCCIPAPSVRPELYVTIAPPQPRALQGKYGIYPERSMPPSALGESAVENVTNKVNGLPQFGCYRKVEKAQQRRALVSTRYSVNNNNNNNNNDVSRDAYADADLEFAQQQATSSGQAPPSRAPGMVSCCCGCCLIDSQNSMCMWNCDRGGCVSCRHPTACCVRCPICCLSCEVCLCFPCAVLGNRQLIRQHYGLQPDSCIDAPTIGCYGCLRTCLLCASSPSPRSGGGGGLVGCCGSLDPNTCCSECAYSLATCLAACFCFCPCVSCAMAQHRDQVERVGFPLLSVFSPPDISGMT